jgi:hypothetical protein
VSYTYDFEEFGKRTLHRRISLLIEESRAPGMSVDPDQLATEIIMLTAEHLRKEALR